MEQPTDLRRGHRPCSPAVPSLCLFLPVQMRAGETGPPCQFGCRETHRSIVLDRRDRGVLGEKEMWALNPQTHGSFWPGNGLWSKAFA